VPTRLNPAKPAPLIVALHGAGGIAGHVLDLVAGSAEQHGIVVLAPESRGSTWDVIRGGYGPDGAFMDQALAKIFALHPVDPSRVALSGFSDGASYALSLGVINGELFDHILAFSPGFVALTTADPPRIFISHGVYDEVLPIAPCSRPIVPELRRRDEPELYCTVPEDRPEPAFVHSDRWLPVGRMDEAAPAPLGFDRKAARVAVRFNGFYLFVAFSPIPALKSHRRSPASAAHSKLGPNPPGWHTEPS
jgi:hypothetical protein